MENNQLFFSSSREIHSLIYALYQKTSLIISGEAGKLKRMWINRYECSTLITKLVKHSS